MKQTSSTLCTQWVQSVFVLLKSPSLLTTESSSNPRWLFTGDKNAFIQGLHGDYIVIF